MKLDEYDEDRLIDPGAQRSFLFGIDRLTNRTFH
jgi:hypothetical protein